MATTLLLDTNVWLDYFLPDRRFHKDSFELVDRSFRKGIRLLISYGSVKDLSYLLQLEFKRSLKSAGIEVTSKESLMAQETAWSCVQQLLENVTVVSAGMNDARMALHLRSVHSDFEDNLVFAAALHADPLCLVTNDHAMRRHSPVKALGPREAQELI